MLHVMQSGNSNWTQRDSTESKAMWDGKKENWKIGKQLLKKIKKKETESKELEVC